MASVTLGKVKFIHRGTYNASTTYSKGDIVNYENRMYIYKNDVPKAHAPIILPTLNGTVASLGIQTSVVRVTFTGFNPTTQVAGIVTSYLEKSPYGPEEWLPRTGLNFYSEWYSANTGITSVNPVSSSAADLYLTSVGINTAVKSSHPVTIGPRRMCGMYEIAENTLDWDLYSEGYNHTGEWQDTTTYYPGDIVKRRNSSYICGVGHSNVDPMFDFPGVWEIFSRGDDLMPYDRCLGFVNCQPWNWHGHPYIPGPKWGSNNQYNGNIPWNTSLGIGSTSPHAWRWNPGWNKGHMSYRGSEAFIAGNGQIVTEGGTSTDYFHTHGTSHMYARENDLGSMIDFNSGEFYDIGNLPLHRVKKAPNIIQAYHSWTSMRCYVLSDGSIKMAGTTNLGYWGYSNDDGGTPNGGWAIPRKMFKNRSIVKVVSGGHQSRDGDTHIIALDEYGEIHLWGRNDTGQCGISSDNHNGNIHYFSNGTHSVNNRAYLVHSMNRDLFFEGNRIVDIWAGHRTSHALDEAGNLWSWGYNHQGQLGYPTNSGFRDSDRSYAPKKIPINWNTYGGIQKFVQASAENLYTMAILDGQGYVWTQGYNGYGQLGNGNTSNGSNSQTIARRTTWTGAATIVNVWVDLDDSGCGHIFYRRSNGDTYGMGYDGHYNLTTGSAPSSRSTPVPIYAPGNSNNQILKNLVSMSSGGRSCGTTQKFLTDTGHCYATGWNGYGSGGVGMDGTIANNLVRHQQNGQRAYAIGRMTGSPFYIGSPTGHDNSFKLNNQYWGGAHCIDVHSTGDYEGNTSHNTRGAVLMDNGELVHSGRGYDWGYGNNRGHIYGTVNAHLIG